MIRAIPEALEVWSTGADEALSWEIKDMMTKFQTGLGPCRLTRLGKTVTLAYRRNLDLSPLDQPGDFL